jgi:RNA polymerase sigma factor (sigma-70 family)
MKRLLRSHPALPAPRTRELAAGFTSAQGSVCLRLAALAYPLERVGQELKAGHLGFFREGSDQDRKRNSGKKSSYRFAGFAPSHVAEFDTRLAERREGRLSASDFEAWQAGFLMRFTFEVIEQVALRAFPPPSPAEAAPRGTNPRQLRADLEKALVEARSLRDEILTGNLLLVAQIVSRRGRFYPTMVLDDLFTAGADGLMIAVGRYDPAVGHFSTYAMPWIKMAIDRFVAKTRNVIRIPIGLQEKVRQQRNRAPAPGAARMEPEWLIPEVQSLEEPVPGFGDGELRLEDVVADPAGSRPREAVEQADIAHILHERLGQLDTVKQFIIAMRNDIGDAAALAAKLFREECALSLGRGRATAAAAGKTLDEPARIRLIGGIRETLVEESADEPEDVAIAA